MFCWERLKNQPIAVIIIIIIIHLVVGLKPRALYMLSICFVPEWHA